MTKQSFWFVLNPCAWEIVAYLEKLREIPKKASWALLLLISKNMSKHPASFSSRFVSFLSQQLGWYHSFSELRVSPPMISGTKKGRGKRGRKKEIRKEMKEWVSWDGNSCDSRKKKTNLHIIAVYYEQGREPSGSRRVGGEKSRVWGDVRGFLVVLEILTV